MQPQHQFQPLLQPQLQLQFQLLLQIWSPRFPGIWRLIVQARRQVLNKTQIASGTQQPAALADVSLSVEEDVSTHVDESPKSNSREVSRSGALAIAESERRDAENETRSPASRRSKAASACEMRATPMPQTELPSQPTVFSDVSPSKEQDSPVFVDQASQSNCKQVSRSGTLAVAERERRDAENEARSPAARRDTAASACETRLTPASQTELDGANAAEKADNKPVADAMCEDAASHDSELLGKDNRHASASGPHRPPKKSRAGALAVRASAAAEEGYQARLAEARRRRAEEAAARRALEEERMLLYSQDQEFQQSLLMDQLKALLERQGPLRKELEALDKDAEEAEKIQKHAAQRLAQFGGLNPRLAEDAARAAERLAAAAERRPDLVAELEEVEMEAAQKNELLAALLI